LILVAVLTRYFKQSQLRMYFEACAIRAYEGMKLRGCQAHRRSRQHGPITMLQFLRGQRRRILAESDESCTGRERTQPRIYMQIKN
jgi:hypothetical protein